MKKELDDLIAAATATKPHVDDLVSVKAKVDSARKDLESITAQLEKLREVVKEERNARAQEIHEDKKRHEAAVMARQNEAEFVNYEVEKAKAELKTVQDDIAKWQKKFEELAAKTNKLEKSLA